LLKWGKIAVGTTTYAKTITLTNSGNAPLLLASITITGDFALQTVAKSCAITKPVAAGGSCVFKVTFKPTKTGPRTGDLIIGDNAPSTPQDVPLSGTGK
jgi:hypothetical protein